MDKRGYLSGVGLLAVLLAGIVVHDMYVDVALEGKSALSTIVENVLPLVASLSLLGGAYWLYGNRDEAYATRVAGWTVVGIVVFGIVAGTVVWMQLVQGELKPAVLVSHFGIFGGVAGALVGYRTATLTETEAHVGQLERSNRQLQQFAYVASHDLQEPLRMVASYMELLADEYEDELDAEADQYIDYAVDGAVRMQAMVDGLLEYSRVTTEGSPFEETDAGAVCRDAVRDLRVLTEEAEGSVEVGELPTVRADPEQLGSVCMNLVKNALEYAGESPTVEVTAEDVGDAYRFAVIDDGPGIPPAHQEDVFRMFRSPGEADGGTGIGLAVSKYIVARHGGDIWIESGDGEGTTVYFTIPKEATAETVELTEGT